MTDKQYLLALTVCFCFFFFEKNYCTYHDEKLIASDFLLQLCLFRDSFQYFVETSSTITLAFVVDTILGHHDGNLQFV